MVNNVTNWTFLGLYNNETGSVLLLWDEQSSRTIYQSPYQIRKQFNQDFLSNHENYEGLTMAKRPLIQSIPAYTCTFLYGLGEIRILT